MAHDRTADTAGPVLADLPRPRATPGRQIAVVADPHVAVDATGTWKVAHRTRERLATAVSVANAHDVDFALVTGDLTRDGTRAEFAAVETILADLTVPWAAIPGNHDVPKSFDTHEGIPVEQFTARFAPGLPFAVDLGPVTLLGVNTASTPDGRLASTWGGLLGDEQMAWLVDRLERVETPVVACHHNLAPLPENPGGAWSQFPLENAATVRELLGDHDVPLAVTAHHHVPALADHGPTTELLAPATCSFPQAMLLVDIGPTGTTVRLVPLADADGIAEARRLARRGKPLGQGILGLVERRLAAFPLAE